MIYLIKYHGFDWTENNSHSARFEILKGYKNSKEEAERYISELKIVTRKEWDGNEYPYYTIEELEVL